MKKREVLVVLISEFADWESAFLSAALNGGLADADPEGLIQPKYTVKTIGLSEEYALSFGGLKTVIDYDIHSCPDGTSAVLFRFVLFEVKRYIYNVLHSSVFKV